MKKINFNFTALLMLFSTIVGAQTFTGIDIWPGSGGSIPHNIVAYNGKVYFSAESDTTSTGYELWVSDGTQGGTALVKDINPGVANSNPEFLTVCYGKLYFYANDGTHGYELWVSDGTSAGTNMVSDIWPGPNGSVPYGFTAFNNKVYFSANDSVHGRELWVTDGTSGGTAMVKDIDPGIGSSSPAGYVPGAGLYILQFNQFNNKLYFRANDGVNGTELWATDGTTAGTNMVANIAPGAASSNPFYMTQLNNSLIFSANDTTNGFTVWITDGTSGGTSMLKNISPNSGLGGGTGPDAADYSGYIPYNGKLYFSALTAAAGYELWVTDGTSAGTNMVSDIWPGPSSSEPGYSNNLFVYNNKLYFPASDSINGNQFWMSDGTAAGTQLVKVLTPYSYFSNPGHFVNYNGQMVFIANQDSVNLEQLWTSDGTAAGTHVIAPAIAPNPNPLYNSSYSYYSDALIIAGGKLFFNANFNSIGDELWVYSTPNGIAQVTGADAVSAYPNPFTGALTLGGLNSSNVYTIKVVDMAGRECYSTMLNGPAQNQTLNLPQLNAGIYLLNITTQGSSQTFKLVKN